MINTICLQRMISGIFDTQEGETDTISPVLDDPWQFLYFSNCMFVISLRFIPPNKNKMRPRPMDPTKGTAEGASFKITDRQLPIANISKIMKDAMPSVAKISKESKELMGKCASEFIAITTCRAKDICDCEARKTITGEDLIRAMEDLDLPYYAELTKILFEKLKEAGSEYKMGKYQDMDVMDFGRFTN